MNFKLISVALVGRQWQWVQLLLLLAMATGAIAQQTIPDFRAGQSFIHIDTFQDDSILVSQTVNGEYPEKRWYKFFKNQLNDNDDSLLFGSIASNQVIENLFIESLNLERIERINAVRGRSNLAIPLRMKNCIVYNTVVQRREPNQKYERQFSKSLVIEHCVFRTGFDLSDGIFIDSVYIENSHFNGIDFSRSTFWKPVTLYHSSVSNQLNCHKVLFKRSRSDASVQSYFALAQNHLKDVEMDDAIFNVPVFFSGTFFDSKFSVYHAQFLQGADLSGVDLDSKMSLNGATFKKFTNLTNIAFHESVADRGRALTDGLLLLENTDLADSIGVDENIIKYGLNLVALKQVWFDLSAFNFNEAERLLASLIQNVNANSNASEELRNDVLARLKYQVIQLQRVNPETSSWDRAVLGILEIIVRNGYEGGGQFFLSSLLIVVFFSLIYQSRYMTDVTFMVKGEYAKNEQQEPKSGLLKKVGGLFLTRLLDFFQAMWFSVYIFLSPKFPSEIFQRSSIFQLIATVEWMFGICMMIVYFVYIASNYAFIRSLLGI
ncbi:hypothetical protein K1X84_09380 [bacterium]|nr:hypothetical protein [bacterium]